MNISSCDPLFSLDKVELVNTSLALFEQAAAIARLEPDKFNFSKYGGLEDFIAHRRLGMESFFADYEQGRAERRYLPKLSQRLEFADFSFDLALSSHYLFTSEDDLDIDSNLEIIYELARVAKEVRIFPLINRDNQTSRFLGPVLLALQQNNYGVEIRNVNYGVSSHANAMLRIWAQQCTLI